MKFGIRICLKPFNDLRDFENNIAQNLISLGPETDNSINVMVNTAYLFWNPFSRRTFLVTSNQSLYYLFLSKSLFANEVG